MTLNGYYDATGQSRRKYQRIKLPVQVILAGETLVADDWSAGGFRIAETTPWPEGEVSVVLDLKSGDFRFRFHLRARRVHHHEPQGFAGYEFVDPQPAQREMMRAIIVNEVSAHLFDWQDILTEEDARLALRQATATGHYDGQAVGLGFAVTLER